MARLSVKRIAAKLRLWYEGEKHRYDFRESRNPYRTWITEIFLQQTQIAAGRAKLKTFLARFPDVKSLAAGPMSDVLAAFQGMGYYSRARNMHRAAVYIVENFRGKVPVQYADLVKIPGIGHYTAAIVSSIHGDEKILALDANHARVLSRLFRIGEQQGSRKFRLVAERAARPIFDGEMPAGDVNEALMQWGQTICRKNPLCEKCFAASHCEAYAAGEVHSYPLRGARVEALDILWLMFIHRKNSKYQVFENKSKFPFLKGEWIFPSVISPLRGVTGLPQEISAAFLKEYMSKAQSLPVDFRHAITRHKISVKLMMVNEAQEGGRYFSIAELAEKCHSSLMQKALRRLDKLEFD